MLNQHKNDEKTMFDSRYGWFEVYHLLQENIPIEEVFEKLKCSKEGLKSDEVEARLSAFGYNKLEEKKVSEPYFSFSIMEVLYTNSFIKQFLLYSFLTLIYIFTFWRRVKYLNFWVSCGILFLGSWKLQPLLLLLYHAGR